MGRWLLATLAGGVLTPAGAWAGALPAFDRGPPDLQAGLVRGGLAALFVLLAVGTTVEVWRAARASPRRASVVGGLVLVTVLGALVRGALAPWTFLHEYYHITDTVLGSLVQPIYRLYGETGPALYQTANALFGGEERAILAVNFALAALTVPAVALLDLALFGRAGRALFAGLLLALLPLHVKFSASESLHIPAALFSVWGLALVARYLATRALLPLLCAAAALALAAQSRPEAVAAVAGAPLLVLFTRPRELRLLVAPRTLLGAALFLALLAPRLVTFFAAPAEQQAAAAGLGPHLLSSQLVLDAAYTPPALWALLLASLAFAAWRREARGAFLWALACAFACAAVPLLFFDHPVYNARTQVLAMPFFCVAVAGALPLAWALLPARPAARALAALVLTAAPAYGLWQRVPYVTELLDQQLEWAFLQRAIPALPAGRELGLLTVRANHGARYLGAFPAFLLHRAGKEMRLIDLRGFNETGQLPEGTPRRLLFYQGMYCFFAYPDEPPPEPFSPRCALVRSRFELRPLLVTTLHTRGYAPAVYKAPPYEIGFFEIVGPTRLTAPTAGSLSVEP